MSTGAGYFRSADGPTLRVAEPWRALAPGVCELAVDLVLAVIALALVHHFERRRVGTAFHSPQHDRGDTSP